MSDQVRHALDAVARRLLLGSMRYSNALRVDTARALLSKLPPAPGPGPGGRKQLLVDVSVIIRKDSGTGIQRVVRELLRHLIEHPPLGYDVRPVYATPWRGYRYAEAFRSRLAGNEGGPTGQVQARSGDVFIGLDLAAHILPRHPVQLGHWKASGVRLHFVVYDLLPMLHPEWFSARLVRRYRNWIRAVAVFSDGVICISQSVSEELKRWLSDTYGNSVADSIAISWFHLGSDISAGGRIQNRPMSPGSGLRNADKRPTVLMVGTVEPRKGYDQALAAFDALWRNAADVNLVIVGRKGWRVEALSREVRRHPQFGDRLAWLENATDEALCAAYEAADGLLVASRGEGFGLPIVECARYGKPILARDLPVHREIAGDGARYFSGDSPEELAGAISTWLDLVRGGKAPASSAIRTLTWSDSARQLLRRVIPD